MTKGEAIVAECHKQGVTFRDQIAYVLATAHHETGGTLQPVREGYYLKNPFKYLRTLRYSPWYGRGLVQLTWKANYAKYERILNLPLVSNPDLVLHFDISAFILVHGMRTGAFTGKKLSDYITLHFTDFYHARRIVNGLDKADRVADLAEDYRARL